LAQVDVHVPGWNTKPIISDLFLLCKNMRFIPPLMAILVKVG
jgi:hypothetical protein